MNTDKFYVFCRAEKEWVSGLELELEGPGLCYTNMKKGREWKRERRRKKERRREKYKEKDLSSRKY